MVVGKRIRDTLTFITTATKKKNQHFLFLYHQEQFVDDDEEDIENPAPTVLSPLQGYRVLVSNLHASVTQEDIIVSIAFSM